MFILIYNYENSVNGTLYNTGKTWIRKVRNLSCHNYLSKHFMAWDKQVAKGYISFKLSLETVNVKLDKCTQLSFDSNKLGGLLWATQ